MGGGENDDEREGKDEGGGRGEEKKKRRKKETRYARDERTGEWINRSRVDGWVSTLRDGGTIENRCSY